jgi:hypothetical protein
MQRRNYDWKLGKDDCTFALRKMHHKCRNKKGYSWAGTIYTDVFTTGLLVSTRRTAMRRHVSARYRGVWVEFGVLAC